MDSQYQKEKEFQKIEKKISKPNILLEQLLVEQAFIDMFRTSHKGLHNYLKLSHFRQMIIYVTIVGPASDKLRSYKYPQVSAEILSSQVPKILEVMFSSIEQQGNSLTLFSLLMKYFQTTPNDTLSGYVIKILSPLYTYQPVKTQQALIQSGQLINMSNFLYSRSVSDFLVKSIVVESQSLLTVYFKERKQLLIHLIGLYQKSQKQDIYMLELAYLLGQVINKLWNEKHKQLGKMAQILIKIIQAVIIKSQLYNQQILIYTIVTNLVNFASSSVHLIKMIINKANKDIFLLSQDMIKTSRKSQINKFGSKKYYLLKSLTHIIINCPKILQEISNIQLLPYKLLDLVVKHEWNSMLHVEVEIIFKQLFKQSNIELFKYLFDKWSLTESIKQMIKKEQRKVTQGYSGILINISTMIVTSINNKTLNGNHLKQKQPLILQICDLYIQPKQQLQNMNLAGYKANTSFSKPQYNQQEILLFNKQFFQKRHILEQIQKLPVSSSSIPEQVYDQIQNQNIVNSSWVLKPVQKV